MEKCRAFYLALLSVLLLTACGHFGVNDPKAVEARAPIRITADSKVKLVHARPVRVKLGFNEEWGESGQGPWCHVNPTNQLHWRPEYEVRYSQALTTVLLQEFKAMNYPIIIRDDGVSQINGDLARNQEKLTNTRNPIQISGTIKKIELNLCYPDNIGGIMLMPLSRGNETHGAGYVQTEWHITSPVEDSKALILSTEGTFKIDKKAAGNDRKILTEAFAVAVRNLLANPEFHALATGNK